MATTIQFYNHTLQLFNSGQCPPTSVYKAELLNSTAAFNATHTQKTQVDNAGAYEVAGNGWPIGGATLQNVACTIVNTSGAKFSADSLAVLISGGSLGPYAKYIVYNDSLANKSPLFMITLNAPLTITDGNIAGITVSANGFFTVSIAA